LRRTIGSRDSLSSSSSSSRRRALGALASLVSVSALAACSSLLGLTDPTTDDGVLGDGGPGGGDGSATGDGSTGGGDGSTTDDGSAPGDAAGGDASCAPGADFSSDKANCGRCGHSCLGGDCTAGVCQPVTLAVAQSNPFGVAVHGTRVYWTSFGANTVSMADKADGKNAGPVAASGVSSPWGIRVDDAFVYWANNETSTGSIARCPLAGCGAAAPTKLVKADEPTDIALFGARLYFTESNSGSVRAIDVADGGAPLDLTGPTINRPFKLVTDGVYVYFTSNENILHSVKVTGGAAVDLVDAVDNSGIALDPATGTVFYTLTGNTGSITTVSKDGGPPTGFAGSQKNPLNVVVDANYVYWTDNGTVSSPANANDLLDGSVLACARPGPCTKPIVLASAQHAASGITIDDTAVYWTNAGAGGIGNGDGALMKVAKP